MDKKIFFVIKGYSELDYSSRKEVREFIQKYEDKEISERRTLIESTQKSLGPTSSNTCPCCGR